MDLRQVEACDDIVGLPFEGVRSGFDGLLEQAALMLTMLPVFMLGLSPGLGIVCFIAIVAVWIELLRRTEYGGKWVCGTFLAVSFILFIYFFPVWTGIRIDRAGYYARMWLQGSNFGNWSWI